MMFVNVTGLPSVSASSRSGSYCSSFSRPGAVSPWRGIARPVFAAEFRGVSHRLSVLNETAVAIHGAVRQHGLNEIADIGQPLTGPQRKCHRVPGFDQVEIDSAADERVAVGPFDEPVG